MKIAYFLLSGILFCQSCKNDSKDDIETAKSNNNAENVIATANGLHSEDIREIHVSTDGRVWALSTQDLFSLESAISENAIVYESDAASGDRHYKKLVLDDSGNVFVQDFGGIYLKRPDVTTMETLLYLEGYTSATYGGSIFDIFTQDGVLYFSGENGIFKANVTDLLNGSKSFEHIFRKENDVNLSVSDMASVSGGSFFGCYTYNDDGIEKAAIMASLNLPLVGYLQSDDATSSFELKDKFQNNKVDKRCNFETSADGKMSVLTNSQLLRSQDKGKTFELIVDNYPSDFREFYIDGDWIFRYTASDDLFYSNNKGQAWSPFQILGNGTYATIRTVTSSGEYLYLGTNQGLFVMLKDKVLTK